MNAKAKAARAALNTYAALIGGERKEPREVQASDLVTDLLLMFEPDVALDILARVERNLGDEQDDVAPVYRAA
jgi:Fe-S cluster assembly ATPase SufC